MKQSTELMLTKVTSQLAGYEQGAFGGLVIGIALLVAFFVLWILA